MESPVGSTTGVPIFRQAFRSECLNLFQGDATAVGLMRTAERSAGRSLVLYRAPFP